MAKVVFAGVVRDCAAHLPAVLSNVERLATLFDEAAYVFVENDSVDATRQMLQSWGTPRPNFSLLNLAGLGRLAIRTLRLEFARNVYLEFIRGDPAFSGFDRLCVLDMDEVGTYPIDVQEFSAALTFMQQTPHCAAIFANQLGPYYDVWALRHPEYCPEDVWYEVLTWARRHGTSDQEAFNQTFARRIRSFARDTPPVEVDSAFGGLGIYNLDYVRRGGNPYLGSRVRVLREGGRLSTFRMQQCEHVHFHSGIRQLGGRLFLFSGLINCVTAAKVTFPASAYRQLCF